MVGEIDQVLAGPRHRAQRVAIAPNQAAVVLWLEFDLCLERIGDRLRGQIEEHDSRLPQLRGPLDTHLVHAPASPIEDALGGLDGA